MGLKQKILVVGAGPVGSLAALYAASRGDKVEIYELRSDLRDPSTTPLNFTRSINLALSERGINAMRHAGHQKLIDHVMGATIPMRGRMIHGKRADGSLYEEPQDYDAHGRCILAIDRGGLNKRLLDILDEMPNVTFFFNHKLTGADFKNNKAWFEVRENGSVSQGQRPREIEVDFDFMIGADGAHSAVRYHMMKYTRMDYQQMYIDTLWCEFQIPPKTIDPDASLGSKFSISPNYLHIWPAKEFMFIAIPSEDGSFTCTLFAPAVVYEHLEFDPAGSLIPRFFDKHFPGVTALIPPADLITQFHRNPHLPLISIKCSPHHYGSSAVILGDAAHAMVPFYGQGMNAGLEDVRILFDILDKHAILDEMSSGVDRAASRARALAEYTAVRIPDAHAINDLALQNYVEMRASVLSPLYRLRKFLEESLSKYVPSLGWQTKYARVSFGNERYSEVVAKSEHQGRMLVRGMAGLVGVPLLAGGIVLVLRYKKALGVGLSAAFGSVDSMVELMAMKV
ncbi:FAD/NAD(P)-binding domain-containing protein [Parathielavia appendiculata]|uniref:Kynurenine 3-monooxygenase n=1 Tax=Parathielavia appendiculata TaxID=2587402 RepID=A0AAN6Z440_9PEZI|nr:FAD/NAD(P)-binding domain-containing protein [Parathielavia appendiculata]